ncbi:hypothetical protein E2C01_018423 [Portunus trituberculatus]|uniref:Uncharacterized protein n=1 Tax=Portunus trituberculatus TaxID=210409 RepID=A0A5B7DW39_PORTR|nr:hypothetical protein [Portunus trituberculatus]
MKKKNPTKFASLLAGILSRNSKTELSSDADDVFIVQPVYCTFTRHLYLVTRHHNESYSETLCCLTTDIFKGHRDR